MICASTTRAGQTPIFPQNQPAYRDAKILVTASDFGCGSSREGAAFALLDFGLKALIGPSFAEIFEGNCVQNGTSGDHAPRGDNPRDLAATAGQPWC